MVCSSSSSSKQLLQARGKPVAESRGTVVLDRGSQSPCILCNGDQLPMLAERRVQTVQYSGSRLRAVF